MKFLTLLALFSLSFACLAQDSQTKKTQSQRNQEKFPMDEADKQVMQRDVCRRTHELVETKYDQFSKEELRKMKEKCVY